MVCPIPRGDHNYGHMCLTYLSPHHYGLTIINEHYHFMTSSYPFPVPVRSTVKQVRQQACKTQIPPRGLTLRRRPQFRMSMPHCLIPNAHVMLPNSDYIPEVMPPP